MTQTLPKYKLFETEVVWIYFIDLSLEILIHINPRALEFTPNPT